MSDEQPTKVRRTEATPSTKQALHTTISNGPFSLLDTAMKNGTKVFVNCRNSKSLIGFVVAFDKHFNLVLRHVTELTYTPNGESTSRAIHNLFLRGESVIFVVKLQES